MARPLLELLFPELPGVRQPLAGETAAPRWVLEKLGFAAGYGVELGLLVDVAQPLRHRPRWPRSTWGSASTATARSHELRPQAVEVLRAALDAGPARRAAAAGTRRRPVASPWPTVVVSNRGPLSFRWTTTVGRWRPPAGGGLASTLHPLLAGTGATWISASMSEADRGGRPGPHGRGRPRLVTVDVDPDTYRMAYDVVSNATLWFCHHHLFDLPRRPRFDRHWHEAWDAYRRLNRASPRPWRPRPTQGAPCSCRTTTSPCAGAMLAAARPDLRTVHFSHTPFADPDMLRVLPGDAAGELLAGLAGFGACGFHTHVGGRLPRPATPAGRAAGGARRTFVAPLGPDAGDLDRGGRLAGVRRGRAPAAGRGGRAPRSCAGSTGWSPPRTSCAGCWPSRSC